MGCCSTKSESMYDIEEAQMRDLRSRVTSDKKSGVSFRSAASAVIVVSSPKNPLSVRRQSSVTSYAEATKPLPTSSSTATTSGILLTTTYSNGSLLIKKPSELSNASSYGGATSNHSTSAHATPHPVDDDEMLVRSVNSDDDLPS